MKVLTSRAQKRCLFVSGWCLWIARNWIDGILELSQPSECRWYRRSVMKCKKRFWRNFWIHKLLHNFDAGFNKDKATGFSKSFSKIWNDLQIWQIHPKSCIALVPEHYHHPPSEHHQHRPSQRRESSSRQETENIKKQFIEIPRKWFYKFWNGLEPKLN